MSTVTDKRRRIQQRRIHLGIRNGPWMPHEDALVRRWAGTLRSDEILALLNVDGVTRTRTALHWRAGKLDVSLDSRERLTLHDLIGLFGSTHRALSIHVVEPKLIPYTRKGNNNGHDISFFRHDVEVFIRSYPWLYCPESLAGGYLGNLGRVIHMGEPWLVLTEVAQYLGLPSHGTMSGLRRHVLPHLPHQHRRLGAKGNTIVVRRADVLAYARDQLHKGA